LAHRLTSLKASAHRTIAAPPLSGAAGLAPAKGQLGIDARTGDLYAAVNYRATGLPFAQQRQALAAQQAAQRSPVATRPGSRSALQSLTVAGVPALGPSPLSPK
jgi:hypothetical protein